MTATISQIRAGLATNLRTITGLRVWEEIPDNPSPPTAIVMLNGISYHRAMVNGLTEYQFLVQVIVGRAAEKQAQRYLDLYADVTGQSSVKAAVESNRTLNGAVQDLVVTAMPNLGSIIVNDQNYLAADFNVTVYA